MQSVNEWAQLNFGSCDVGDKRRTNRLVRVAEEIANNPSASLPNQIEDWGDLYAFSFEIARLLLRFPRLPIMIWQPNKGGRQACSGSSLGGAVGTD